MSTDSRKVSAGLSFVWGMLVFSLAAVIVFAVFRVTGKRESYDDKRAALRLQKLEKLRVEDLEKLNRYAWADPQKGIVRIPVERAMEIEAVELAAKKAQATDVKVEIPYPAGLQQAPPAAATEVKK
jgi:hypothetical protein